MVRQPHALSNFLLRAIALRRRQIAGLAVLAAIAQASILAILNTAADRAEGGIPNLYEALQFLSAGLLFAAAQLYMMRAAARQVEQAIHEQRMALIRRVHRAEFADFSKIAEGDFIGPIWKETQALSQSATHLTAACQSAVLLLFCSLYIAWLSPLALVLILGTAMAGVLAYLARVRRMTRHLHQVLSTENKLYGQLRDLLHGFRELKLSPRGAAALTRAIEVTSGAVRDGRRAHENMTSRAFTESQLTFYFVTASIVFILPSLSPAFPGVVVKLAGATLFMASPISILANAIPVFTNARASIENIRALEDRLSLIEAPATSSEQREDFVRIELAGVTFAHRDAEDVVLFTLGPLDFTLCKGEVVFVTGGNGSGKSTFVHLLCGLHAPERGTIGLDGLPVEPDGRPSYRTLFSVIFSDMHLFQRLYGLDEALDPRRVAEVLDLLELANKVAIVDGAFSTIDLSAGQRKRLALAASILHRRPILILDEWAADQDPQFRRKFYEVIVPWLRTQGFTVVAVTHDDRYFAHADRRIHLTEGRIDETIGEIEP